MEAAANASHATKSVTFVTAVILGADFKGMTDASRLVTYAKDSRIHSSMPPQECEALPNGLVIDMPLHNTE